MQLVMRMCSQSTGRFRAYELFSTMASSVGVFTFVLLTVKYLQQSMSMPSRLVSMVTLSMVPISQPVTMMAK